MSFRRALVHLTLPPPALPFSTNDLTTINAKGALRADVKCL